MFSEELSKLSESIIFRNVFTSVEELNYMKDYMTSRCEASGN